MQLEDRDIQARRDAAARLLESLRVHGAPEPEPPPGEPPLLEAPDGRPTWLGPERVVRAEPPDWPAYCCAILRDGEGNYLLERRPPDAKDAPGKLACFGGKRERMEHPDRCLRRELQEELRWRVGALRLEVAVRLVEQGTGKPIAWFYRALTPPSLTTRPNRRRLRTLPGSDMVWLAPSELATADLSAWHRAALEAERRGEAVAEAGP